MESITRVGANAFVIQSLNITMTTTTTVMMTTTMIKGIRVIQFYINSIQFIESQNNITEHDNITK